MKHLLVPAALVLALLAGACGRDGRTEEAPGDSTPARDGDAAAVAFTESDLDQFERGLRSEVEAVKAAQQKAAAAANAQERGEAIQAQWETATIPAGAQASGLGDARYRDIREAVNRAFTLLDFKGEIDGPLSIDLERADAETKARVSGDAFAGLPPASAASLRARMDRLVPLWSEYKTLVAVAG